MRTISNKHMDTDNFYTQRYIYTGPDAKAVLAGRIGGRQVKMWLREGCEVEAQVNIGLGIITACYNKGQRHAIEHMQVKPQWLRYPKDGDKAAQAEVADDDEDMGTAERVLVNVGVWLIIALLAVMLVTGVVYVASGGDAGRVLTGWLFGSGLSASVIAVLAAIWVIDIRKDD